MSFCLCSNSIVTFIGGGFFWFMYRCSLFWYIGRSNRPIWGHWARAHCGAYRPRDWLRQNSFYSCAPLNLLFYYTVLYIDLIISRLFSIFIFPIVTSFLRILAQTANVARPSADGHWASRVSRIARWSLLMRSAVCFVWTSTPPRRWVSLPSPYYCRSGRSWRGRRSRFRTTRLSCPTAAWLSLTAFLHEHFTSSPMACSKACPLDGKLSLVPLNFFNTISITLASIIRLTTLDYVQYSLLTV